MAPTMSSRVESAMVPSEKKAVELIEWGVKLEEQGEVTRRVEVYNESGSECFSMGAAAGTKTQEVVTMVAAVSTVDPGKIRLVKSGAYNQVLSIFDTIPPRMTALGVRSFRRQRAKFEHPVLIIGAGLGGIQTMITFIRSGRTDFHCFEKLHDFGGHSWMTVANRFTKLQTEKGTYFVDYILKDLDVPVKVDGSVGYSTWPSRDQLLAMFRESSRRHGLYERTSFNTNVERVKVLPGKKYAVATTSADMPDEPGELVIGGAVMAWPGNLTLVNKIDFPGEADFGGYIEYCSFGYFDYTRAAGKTCILYGHGAFTIENVRTLVEQRCKKVIIMCRKRNLCGMKVVSWMVGYSEVPMPGTVVLEAMKKIYDLVGFDPWDAHCVKTDAKRTFAHLSQRTVFGVTDVYFLAGYYGLMEVVEDEIKRLGPNKAYTKKGKELECEVVLKAIGTVPDFAIDKMLGLKELVGMWVNGDPLRPCSCNAMYVEARNFGSFSSGPAFAGAVVACTYFIDYPGDFDAVREQLPINKPGERPGYVPTSAHMGPTMTTIGQNLPHLGSLMGQMDSLKAQRQRKIHPPDKYIEECKAEWRMYIDYFKENGMVDDRPEPEYPYTADMVDKWLLKSEEQWLARLQRG